MALGCSLPVGANKLNGSLVYLDARQNTTFLEDINKWFAAGCFLIKGLLKEDDTTDVLEGPRSAEEKFTKSTAIGLNVLDIDAG